MMNKRRWSTRRSNNCPDDIVRELGFEPTRYGSGAGYLATALCGSAQCFWSTSVSGLHARAASAREPYQGEPSVLPVSECDCLPSWPQGELGEQSSGDADPEVPSLSPVTRLLPPSSISVPPTYAQYTYGSNQSHTHAHKLLEWIESKEPAAQVKASPVKDVALTGPRPACFQVAHRSSPVRYGVREDTPRAAQHFSHTRVSMCVLYRGHGERG